MKTIASVRKCDQKPRVGNRFHGRENPFRRERFGSPETVPASLIKERPFVFRARSSSVRIILPFLSFVLRDVSSSHSFSSSVMRIVIVRLIWHNCNTPMRRKANLRESPLLVRHKSETLLIREDHE